MAPSKRTPPKPPKIVRDVSKSLVNYCSTCENKGDEIYELVYLCNEKVNYPKGNHSMINCLKFK